MTTVDARIGSADYHQQDDADFCGQAVAQMILGGLGAPVGDQVALRRQAGITGVGTTADELCRTLNLNRPDDTDPFVVCIERTAVDCARRLFTALTASGLAVPALVLDGSHWVAVTGVVFDGCPDGASTDVLGFFIDNPEPQNPTKPCGERLAAPPHGKDDTCGMVSPRCADYGSANTFVTVFEWMHFYLKAGGTNGTAFVMIVSRSVAGLTLRGSVDEDLVQPSVAEATISKAEACTAALNGIVKFALDGSKSPLAPLIAGADARPDEVFTVAELPANFPRLGSAEPYYLVVLRLDHVQVANARVGMAEGRFLSLQAPPSAVPGPHELFDFATEALLRYEAETHDLDARVIDERRFTVHPTLVWRRSAQSMSPFHPFVQINVAGRLVYASMDRQIHLCLDNHHVVSDRRSLGGLTAGAASYRELTGMTEDET